MILNKDPQAFQIGFDGFYWFIGVVESVIDPLNVGRAKVRILGWHEPDTDVLSTDDLPWAFPIRPITHSNVPSNVRVGDWIVGFFLDGKLGQQPMMFGVFPAIQQTQ
jgi:hypothetical protein